MKPQRSCRHCCKPLTTEDARFTIASDSEGGPTGDWCSIRCYTVTRYGAKAEEVYATLFASVVAQAPIAGAPAAISAAVYPAAGSA